MFEILFFPVAMIGDHVKPEQETLKQTVDPSHCSCLP